MAQTEAVFDDRFYVVPMVSSALTPSDRPQKNGYGGGLVIGKTLFPRVGIEILGDYLRYTGLPVGDTFPAPRAPSTEVYGGGVGLNLYWSPLNQGLFLHGNAEFGKQKSMVYNGGLGVDFRVTETGILLRVQALYHKEEGEDGLPLIKLGVRIPIGAQPQAAVPVEAAPEPEQTPEVPAEEPPPAPEPPPPEPPPPPPPCATGSLEGCKGGETVVLKGVNFDFDKATLTPNAKVLLDGVADSLIAHPEIKVEIGGHTDGRGADTYNQKLSQRRSESVQAYLADRGIAADRMSNKGYGESMPVADNNTDEGRETNRRVELKVTESGATPVATSEPAPSETPSAEAPAAEPAPAESTPAEEPAADAPAAEAPADAPAETPADAPADAPPQ
ncbi:MAG: OmpA family protein [Pseudomonadota bacterium]